MAREDIVATPLYKDSQAARRIPWSLFFRFIALTAASVSVNEHGKDGDEAHGRQECKRFEHKELPSVTFVSLSL
jgi:hypothetical protein